MKETSRTVAKTFSHRHTVLPLALAGTDCNDARLPDTQVFFPLSQIVMRYHKRLQASVAAYQQQQQWKQHIVIGVQVRARQTCSIPGRSEGGMRDLRHRHKAQIACIEIVQV